MAASRPAKKITASPNGLFGAPPGIRDGKFGLSRLTTGGGTHASRRPLPLMKVVPLHCLPARPTPTGDRKSTRLNSSHVAISYAVFCLKKKKNNLIILFFQKKKKKNINKIQQK